MPLTTRGLTAMVNNLIGTSIYPEFNNANSHIGVGDSETAFSPDQNDLQATDAVRKVYRPMAAGFPKFTGPTTVEFKAVFPAGVATFPWYEWGVFNSTKTDKDMLNRAQQYLGNKQAGQTWALQVELHFVVVGGKRSG